MTDDETITKTIDGVAYVLPKFETIGLVKKLGRFAVFATLRFDAFGIGIQFLKAGLMIEIGPAWVGVSHIKRQIAAFAEEEQRFSERMDTK